MKVTNENFQKVLEDLKSLAKQVDENEDSVFLDYRNMAEFAKREIIDTLLELEMEG